MEWMRYDKCGGMSILATMQMLDAMQTDLPVIGILGAAENMPDASATRPGDIIKMHNGKTVEVLNTDAEGRLILADILSYSAKYKPECIVDVATLTGAVIVALGHAASAALGSDQLLINELLAAGSSSGERLWQLPLYAEYLEDMQSDFADLANLSKSGNAGTATAAAFLSAFVPPDIPWVHLDIAGTAWEMSDKPYQAAGATLFGARLLTQWICDRDIKNR
jgi:leucyl aminopeptidase